MVVVGDSFSTKDIFGKAVVPGSKININGKDFEVIGILEKKGNFQVDAAVLMNDNDVRDLFDIPKDVYDLIAVKYDTNLDVKLVEHDITKVLRKVRDVKEGEEDFAVQTPASILSQVNTVLIAVQIFVYVIAAISILVGGIGIMNTMYTAVVERTKEIGIMKSIGAKNSAIFWLFFMESGLLGSVGGIVGTGIGFTFASMLAYIGKLILGSDLIAAKFSPFLILGAIFFSFVLGTIFGTLPAIQASKMNPIDALRFVK
jgi:putative ABC transport system permease protein